MIEVKKLTHTELQKIIDLGGRSFLSKVTPDTISFINTCRHYHSIYVDGELHACMGVTPYWNCRGDAWIIFNPQTKHKSVFGVRRVVMKLLDECPIKRVEASVAIDEHFKVADKWAQSLGFEMEHPRLRNYLPNGSDAALYSRIKESA